jgi:hypothetical protein
MITAIVIGQKKMAIPPSPCKTLFDSLRMAKQKNDQATTPNTQPIKNISMGNLCPSSEHTQPQMTVIAMRTSQKGYRSPLGGSGVGGGRW